eukprot:PhF_6_TR41650/c0_g1_i1/m.63142
MSTPIKRERSEDVEIIDNENEQIPPPPPKPTNPNAQHLVENPQDATGILTIKNSPYPQAERTKYGWGNPFSPCIKAVVENATFKNFIRIGISSLNGVPAKDKDRQMSGMMKQYVTKFPLVLEHCNPYHRLGDEATWRQWTTYAPNPQFQYAIKCNKYLSHDKLLKMDDELKGHVERFVNLTHVLGSHLGPILIQLPPQFHYSEEHLTRFLALAPFFPATMKIAIELRHKSWFRDETYEVLKTLKWALVCAHDAVSDWSPLVDTGAGFMYYRLHGSVQMYGGDYGPAVMDTVAGQVVEYVKKAPGGNMAYVMLNNNESGISGLTSSIVDTTYLAKKITALLK